MANEITARWHDSGSTLYAQVLNTTGAVYNGSTFETPADANWGNYDIALTEAGTTRFYRGTFPAVAAGLYTVLLYEQAGASPAVADTIIGLGEVQWDGSAVLALSGLNDITAADVLAAIEAATIDGTITRIQKERIELAIMAGKSTGGGTASVAFRDQADAKNRVAATVDNDGNRTAVTLDGS